MPVAPKHTTIVDVAPPVPSSAAAVGAEPFAAFLEPPKPSKASKSDAPPPLSADDGAGAEPAEMIDMLLPLIEQQRATQIASPGDVKESGRAAAETAQAAPGEVPVPPQPVAPHPAGLQHASLLPVPPQPSSGTSSVVQGLEGAPGRYAPPRVAAVRIGVAPPPGHPAVAPEAAPASSPMDAAPDRAPIARGGHQPVSVPTTGAAPAASLAEAPTDPSAPVPREMKAPDAAKSDVVSTKHGDQPSTAAAIGDAAPARQEGRSVTVHPVIAGPGEAKPHASVPAAVSLGPEQAQAVPLSDRKERAQPGVPTQAGAQSPLAAPVVPIAALDRGGVPAPVPQMVAASPAAERFEVAAAPAGVSDPPAAPAVASPVMAAAAPVPVPGTVAGLAQALAAEVLNMAADGAWIDELARDISRMASGAGDLRFRLTPESLGELRVEISQSERGALVRMSVTSEAAQAALAEAQPKLLAEARAQGVRIADAQVDLTSSHQHKGDTQRQQPDQAGRPSGAPRATHNEMRPAAGTAVGRTDRYA